MASLDGMVGAVLQKLKKMGPGQRNELDKD